MERRVPQLVRSLCSRRCVSINYSRMITLSSEECTFAEIGDEFIE